MASQPNSTTLSSPLGKRKAYEAFPASEFDAWVNHLRETITEGLYPAPRREIEEVKVPQLSDQAREVIASLDQRGESEAKRSKKRDVGAGDDDVRLRDVEESRDEEEGKGSSLFGSEIGSGTGNETESPRERRSESGEPNVKGRRDNGQEAEPNHQRNQSSQSNIVNEARIKPKNQNKISEALFDEGESDYSEEEEEEDERDEEEYESGDDDQGDHSQEDQDSDSGIEVIEDSEEEEPKNQRTFDQARPDDSFLEVTSSKPLPPSTSSTTWHSSHRPTGIQSANYAQNRSMAEWSPSVHAPEQEEGDSEEENDELDDEEDAEGEESNAEQSDDELVEDEQRRHSPGDAVKETVEYAYESEEDDFISIDEAPEAGSSRQPQHPGEVAAHFEASQCIHVEDEKRKNPYGDIHKLETQAEVQAPAAAVLSQNDYTQQNYSEQVSSYPDQFETNLAESHSHTQAPFHFRSGQPYPLYSPSQYLDIPSGNGLFPSGMPSYLAAAPPPAGEEPSVPIDPALTMGDTSTEDSIHEATTTLAMFITEATGNHQSTGNPFEDDSAALSATDQEVAMAIRAAEQAIMQNAEEQADLRGADVAHGIMSGNEFEGDHGMLLEQEDTNATEIQPSIRNEGNLMHERSTEDTSEEQGHEPISQEALSSDERPEEAQESASEDYSVMPIEIDDDSDSEADQEDSGSEDDDGEETSDSESDEVAEENEGSADHATELGDAPEGSSENMGAEQDGIVEDVLEQGDEDDADSLENLEFAPNEEDDEDEKPFDIDEEDSSSADDYEQSRHTSLDTEEEAYEKEMPVEPETVADLRKEIHRHDLKEFVKHDETIDESEEYDIDDGRPTHTDGIPPGHEGYEIVDETDPHAMDGFEEVQPQHPTEIDSTMSVNELRPPYSPQLFASQVPPSDVSEIRRNPLADEVKKPILPTSSTFWGTAALGVAAHDVASSSAKIDLEDSSVGLGLHLSTTKQGTLTESETALTSNVDQTAAHENKPNLEKASDAKANEGTDSRG